MNLTRVAPLADHVLCVKLEREDVDRILTSQRQTSRDVTEAAAAPRIAVVGAEPIRFALVLATGSGRVYESGRRVEPEVKPGDIVLYREAEPRLDLPFRAKELVVPLALDERLHNAGTCMMLEALMLGVVS